ncbi:MAG: Hsp33 family molecular chaperone HslO [Alphaproteobacteria bacterium]
MSAAPLDDIVAAFQIEGAPALGRYTRLADRTIDPVLLRHDYPRPVALLLGEALALAALVGSLFKVTGRLIVQAEGKGDVPLLVAEYRSGENTLRGYARIAKGAREKLSTMNAAPPSELLGAGALVMTLEQNEGATRHQGVVPLDGDTLAQCAEGYFAQSEQVPTRIKLAVGESYARGERPAWRAGGALIQKIADDTARGSTDEAWARAEVLFATLTDQELLDPGLSADRVLYRLFHEDGVRMSAPDTLIEKCHCNRERLTTLLGQFPDSEIADLIEPDGLIHAHCEFCSRLYLIAPEDLKTA